MSILSAGRVSAAEMLLRRVSERSLTSLDVDAFGRIGGVSASEALHFAMACGWIHAESGEKLALSSSGALAAASEGAESLLRRAIVDFATQQRPTWVSLIPRGRSEAFGFLPAPVAQCFQEAGLMEPLDAETLEWWDALALLGRGELDIRRNAIGREGERLSYEYELGRTGREPLWQAVESNLAGYDILSVQSSTDFSPLPIEVKSSTRSLQTAMMYMSRNEWDTLVGLDEALIHLWILQADHRFLAIVTLESLHQHIPEDRGDGQWDQVHVPFAVFSDSFTAA